MADQILNVVIQLENQIEQQLQLERQRADAWLNQVVHELDIADEQERRRIEADGKRFLEEAEREIEARCTELLNSEKEYRRRLEGLDDQVLLEVLNRQLKRILPRPVDDHQNGES